MFEKKNFLLDPKWQDQECILRSKLHSGLGLSLSFSHAGLYLSIYLSN